MTIISTLRTIREIIEELTKIYDGLKRWLVEIIVLILIATGKIPLELLIVVVLMNTLPHLAALFTLKPPSGGFKFFVFSEVRYQLIKNLSWILIHTFTYESDVRYAPSLY
jgi:hypothetical protein